MLIDDLGLSQELTALHDRSGRNFGGKAWRSLPFKPEMAFSASSLFGISTKPKPQLSPLNLSVMIEPL